MSERVSTSDRISTNSINLRKSILDLLDQLDVGSMLWWSCVAFRQVCDELDEEGVGLSSGSPLQQ